MFFHCCEDYIGATTAQLTGRGGAELQVIFTYRSSVTGRVSETISA